MIYKILRPRFRFYSLTRNCTREEYKERIKNEDYAAQIVKLADMVHNRSELSEKLPYKTVRRKIDDSEKFYLELAKKICPEFYIMLIKHLEPWK